MDALHSYSEYPSLAEVHRLDPATIDAIAAQLSAARLRYIPGDYRAAIAKEQQQSDGAAAPLQSNSNTAPIKPDQPSPHTMPSSPRIAAYSTLMPAPGVMPVHLPTPAWRTTRAISRGGSSGSSSTAANTSAGLHSYRGPALWSMHSASPGSLYTNPIAMPRKNANLSLVDVLTPAPNPFAPLFEEEAVAVNSADLETDHGVMLRLVGNTLALTVLGGLLATTAAMAVMAPPYVAALALLHAAQSRAKAPSSTSACTKLGKYQRKNLRRRMKRNAHRVSPGGALLVEQQASSSHSASVVPQNAIAMLQAAPVLPQAAPVLPQGAPAIPQAARATPPSTSMLSSVGSMVVRNTVAVPVTLAVMGGGAVLAGTGMACLGVVTTCKVAESGCSLLRNVFGCRGR